MTGTDAQAVVVTGAGGGGRAFGARQARVALLARGAEGLRAAAEDIHPRRHRLIRPAATTRGHLIR